MQQLLNSQAACMTWVVKVVKILIVANVFCDCFIRVFYILTALLKYLDSFHWNKDLAVKAMYLFRIAC